MVFEVADQEFNLKFSKLKFHKLVLTTILKRESRNNATRIERTSS